MEAVELLREADMNIPEWQKDLVNLEKKKIADNPSILVDWQEAKQKFKRP